MADTTTNPQAGCCSAAPKLIFARSGAADVGKLSDLAGVSFSKRRIRSGAKKLRHISSSGIPLSRVFIA
ncbi:MAG: hypothetical protein ACOY3P_06295 [Planctomycetota bacterium]